LRAVAQTPTRMAELGRPRVREAIITSSDQAAAVGMMLQASSLPDPAMMVEHANLVLGGRVSPWLMWEKHPATLAGTVILALALLLMLKRLMLGTRAKIVVRDRAGFTGGGGRR
jgi:hypothetical protein